MNRLNSNELPPARRAAHYRELAEEMRSRATAAKSNKIRSAYLNIAVQWLDMAEKLDAEYGKISVVVEAPELASLLRRVRAS
jgi:hypothetical protein